MKASVKETIVRNLIRGKIKKVKQEEAAQIRATRKRFKESHPNAYQPTGTILICPICDSKFKKWAPNQVYCGPNCTAMSQKDGKKFDRWNQWLKKRKADPFAVSRGPRGEFDTCIVCGEMYYVNSPAQKYCKKHSDMSKTSKGRKELDRMVEDAIVDGKYKILMIEHGDKDVKDLKEIIDSDDF